MKPVPGGDRAAKTDERERERELPGDVLASASPSASASAKSHRVALLRRQDQHWPVVSSGGAQAALASRKELDNDGFGLPAVPAGRSGGHEGPMAMMATLMVAPTVVVGERESCQVCRRAAGLQRRRAGCWFSRRPSIGAAAGLTLGRQSLLCPPLLLRCLAPLEANLGGSSALLFPATDCGSLQWARQVAVWHLHLATTIIIIILISHTDSDGQLLPKRPPPSQSTSSFFLCTGPSSMGQEQLCAARLQGALSVGQDKPLTSGRSSKESWPTGQEGESLGRLRDARAVRASPSSLHQLWPLSSTRLLPDVLAKTQMVKVRAGRSRGRVEGAKEAALGGCFVSNLGQTQWGKRLTETDAFLLQVCGCSWSLGGVVVVVALFLCFWLTNIRQTRAQTDTAAGRPKLTHGRRDNGDRRPAEACSSKSVQASKRNYLFFYFYSSIQKFGRPVGEQALCVGPAKG